MEVSGKLDASAALTPRKDPRYPLNMRLRGPQNRDELGGKVRKIPAPAGTRTPAV